MIDIKSIQSLTDFKRNTSEHLERLHKTGKPLVLTVNGKAECVVLDADSYQDMVDRIEHAESVWAIQAGIDSVSKDGARPAEDFLKEMSEKYGLPS